MELNDSIHWKIRITGLGYAVIMSNFIDTYTVMFQGNRLKLAASLISCLVCKKFENRNLKMANSSRCAKITGNNVGGLGSVYVSEYSRKIVLLEELFKKLVEN